MKYPVDLSLFDDTKHSPSIFALTASMGDTPGRLRDYCIPVNPYFPTPAVFASLRQRFQTILKFYPSSNQDIAARLADFVGLDPETIVLGNGSTELISWINRLMVTESLAIPVPTFSRWTEDPTLSGKKVHTFLRLPENNFRLTPGEFVAGVLRRGARAAVLCNPNNPTGALMDPADVLRVLDALADLDVVIIDESFIDFAAEESVPSIDREVARFPNAVVLKSLGKNLGLHGLRMGYAVAHPDLIGRLRRALPFWNLNSVAQALIEELAGARSEYEVGRRHVVRDRIYLESRLRAMPGLRVYPAQANFVYVRIPDGIDGVSLRNHLLTEHGCLLRECGNKLGSDSQHFRIAARPTEEVDYLMKSLSASFTALAGLGLAPAIRAPIAAREPPPPFGAALPVLPQFPRGLTFDPGMSTGVLALPHRTARSRVSRAVAVASGLIAATLIAVAGGFVVGTRAGAPGHDPARPPAIAAPLPSPSADPPDNPAAVPEAAPTVPATAEVVAAGDGESSDAAGPTGARSEPARAQGYHHKKLRMARHAAGRHRHARGKGTRAQERALASRDDALNRAD